MVFAAVKLPTRRGGKRLIFLTGVCCACFFICVNVGGARGCAEFGFGVSPPHIKQKALEPGGKYTREIHLTRDCPNGDYRVDVIVNASAIEKWLVIKPGKSLKFSPGEDTAILRIVIVVPEAAAGGNYHGSILLIMTPIVNDASGTVISTRIGARLNIDLAVMGSVVSDFSEPRQFSISDYNLYSRLKGKIILKVEDYGRAFYVHPDNWTAYYLGRPADAFLVMREQGIGITNQDLDKIPPAVDYLSGRDTDGDGLPDTFEDAVGLASDKRDTDGDGNSDMAELTNPSLLKRVFGNSKTDIGFSRVQAGKIFLQTESRGEAWYVNPNDGKRYYLGRPADAFNIMRGLGWGISNNDFDTLVGISDE